MNVLADGGPELLAMIADGLPVGVWVGRASDGKLVYANRAFEELTGVAPISGPRSGRALVAHYRVHTRSGAPYPVKRIPSYVRALRQRTPVMVDDPVVHHPDGRQVNLRASAKPLVDSAGTITHVMVTLTDITQEVAAERARAESEARVLRAQRLESIGKLAGGIAHDFNNLLATVKVLASLLRMGEGDALRLENLHQIEQAVGSGIQLTRSLLDFARRDARLEQQVSLNEVARTVLGLAERTLGPRIEVECNLSAEADGVLGEASRLEQVVLNVVMNARDAMPRGGKLTLRTRDVLVDEAEARRAPALKPGRYVGLDVTDTGAGIDPAIRDRIFEPYFTTRTHGSVKGTGLGLATAHGIIEAHRGLLEVVPDAGPGTTMRVLLPAAPSGASRPRSRRHDTVLQPGKGKVLLVEDEPALSRASARALTHLGYQVLCAMDGESAVELFRSRRHEVVAVVLDMILPRMDGWQTFVALREVDPDVRVVVTSGLVREETRRDMLESGVRHFLPKPYDAEELSQAIARVARTPAPGA